MPYKRGRQNETTNHKKQFYATTRGRKRCIDQSVWREVTNEAIRRRDAEIFLIDVYDQDAYQRKISQPVDFRDKLSRSSYPLKSLNDSLFSGYIHEFALSVAVH